MHQWNADTCRGSYDRVYSKRNGSCSSNLGNSFLLVLCYSLTILGSSKSYGLQYFSGENDWKKILLESQDGDGSSTSGFWWKGKQHNCHLSVLKSQKCLCFLKVKLSCTNDCWNFCGFVQTGGYTTANYIWDMLQTRNIIPALPAVEAYYKGLKVSFNILESVMSSGIFSSPWSPCFFRNFGLGSIITLVYNAESGWVLSNFESLLCMPRNKNSKACFNVSVCLTEQTRIKLTVRGF